MQAISEYRTCLISCSNDVKKYFAALVLSSVSRGIFMVLFNLYLRDLGFNEAFVGQAVSLQALASVIILIPAGIMSDRLGRLIIMVAGCIIKSAALLLVAFTQAGSFLLILSFSMGLGQALLMVNSAPFLAENTGVRERMHLFSINWSMMMFSTMLGNVLGGWLADSMESYLLLGPVFSKQITIFIASILGFVAVIPLFRAQEKRKADKSSWRSFFRNLRGSGEMGIILRFVAASLLLGLGAGLIVPYFNLYFASVFDLRTGSIGVIMAAGQAVMALAMLIGAPVAQRLGRVRTICLLQISSVIFLLILGQTYILYLAIISFMFRAALVNAANPINMNLMMENVSDGLKGTASSLHQMVFQLGWAICGPISGLLITAYSYQFVYNVAAIFYVFSTLFFWIVFRALDEPGKEEQVGEA